MPPILLVDALVQLLSGDGLQGRDPFQEPASEDEWLDYRLSEDGITLTCQGKPVPLENLMTLEWRTPVKTPDQWVKEAKALLEMGASQVDSNTLRGVLAKLADLEAKPAAQEVKLEEITPVLGPTLKHYYCNAENLFLQDVVTKVTQKVNKALTFEVTPETRCPEIQIKGINHHGVHLDGQLVILTKDDTTLVVVEAYLEGMDFHARDDFQTNPAQLRSEGVVDFLLKFIDSCKYDAYKRI
jgi:hypothetical protein